MPETKEASTTAVYLTEHLGSARLLCERLVGYVDRSVDLVNKAKSKDSIFAQAGDIIQEVPLIVCELQKKLQAASLVAISLDSDSLKQDLPQREVEELDNLLEGDSIQSTSRRGTVDTKLATTIISKVSSDLQTSGELRCSILANLVTALDPTADLAALDLADQHPTEAGDLAKHLAHIVEALESPPEGATLPSRKALASLLLEALPKKCASKPLEIRDMKTIQKLLENIVVEARKGEDPALIKSWAEKALSNLKIAHNFKLAKGLDIRDLKTLQKLLEDIIVDAKKSDLSAVEDLAKRGLKSLKLASTAQLDSLRSLVVTDARNRPWLISRRDASTGLASSYRLLVASPDGSKAQSRLLSASEVEKEVEIMTDRIKDIRSPRATFSPLTSDPTAIKMASTLSLLENRLVQLKEASRAYVTEGSTFASETFLRLAKETSSLVARYEKGVPADPTENMSQEDARVWEDMNDEYGDKLKQAATEKYLYVYTGANGPISNEFGSPNFAMAESIAKKNKRGWFDDAENFLGLDEGASDSQVERAAKSKGYKVKTSIGPDMDLWTKNSKTASALQWKEVQGPLGPMWLARIKDQRGDTFTWEIREIQGPGIPLYRVSLMLSPTYVFKWKRQVKSLREAKVFAAKWSPSLVDEGTSVDLTSDFVKDPTRYASSLSWADEDYSFRSSLSRGRNR